MTNTDKHTLEHEVRKRGGDVNNWSFDEKKLLPLFEKLTNGMGSDWKESFSAFIPADQFNDYAEAAYLYTNAALKIRKAPRFNFCPAGELYVVCDGYYVGTGEKSEPRPTSI